MSETAASTGSGPREEILSGFAFRLGPTLFLCDAASVEAVISTVAPTPLPRVPPHVLGLVNHDHRALAVIDLGRLLEIGGPATPSVRTLVLRAGELHVGVPVQAALGVLAVRAKELTPPSGAFGPRVEGFLRGTCETPHGPAGWLDLHRLLESARV